MIDLHFHCLPGVDDGPVDLSEAVAMCRAAASDGCSTLVATPHQRCPQWWNSSPDTLRDLRHLLQNAVGEHPRIELGAEIRIGPDLLQALDAPDKSGVLTLSSSRYLLLEFNRQGPWPEPDDLVHELVLGKWRPIFAHPEFVPFFASNLQLMERLIEAGARFQVTAMSLTGGFGQRIRKTALRMLDADVVHFVASDAHDTKRRPPGLQGAYREIERRKSEDVAWKLTAENPGRVVENALIGVS